MLLVILKTQVFSASTLSEAVAATIREIPGYCPRTLASGNEQHVPIRLHASDSPLPPCWRESVQVRFIPVCVCFILKCTDDYYCSLKCQNSVNPVSEGLYLRAVIKPLYCFIHDQAMSPLMESLCSENVIMITSLVMMM